MSVSLQFFGVAGYKIVTADGKHIVVDPFLEKNPYTKITVKDLGRVDVLLITHNAFDHFGDAPAVINEYHPVTVCALDVLHNLTNNHGIEPDLLRATIWGMRMEVEGVQVTPVESHHWSFARLPDGQLLSGPALGFMIDVGDGHVVYHPGDTALFSDLKTLGELFKPTIGLIHVSLPAEPGVQMPHPECYHSGELTPYEALLASKWLGVKEIVASHYVDPDTKDVKDFLELVEVEKRLGVYNPNVHVLAPDSEMTFEPGEKV